MNRERRKMNHEQEIQDRQIKIQHPHKDTALEGLFTFFSLGNNLHTMTCTDFKCTSNIFPKNVYTYDPHPKRETEQSHHPVEFSHAAQTRHPTTLFSAA